MINSLSLSQREGLLEIATAINYEQSVNFEISSLPRDFILRVINQQKTEAIQNLSQNGNFILREILRIHIRPDDEKENHSTEKTALLGRSSFNPQNNPAQQEYVLHRSNESAEEKTDEAMQKALIESQKALIESQKAQIKALISHRNSILKMTSEEQMRVRKVVEVASSEQLQSTHNLENRNNEQALPSEPPSQLQLAGEDSNVGSSNSENHAPNAENSELIGIAILSGAILYSANKLLTPVRINRMRHKIGVGFRRLDITFNLKEKIGNYMLESLLGHLGIKKPEGE